MNLVLEVLALSCLWNGLKGETYQLDCSTLVRLTLTELMNLGVKIFVIETEIFVPDLRNKSTYLSLWVSLSTNLTINAKKQAASQRIEMKCVIKVLGCTWTPAYIRIYRITNYERIKCNLRFWLCSPRGHRMHCSKYLLESSTNMLALVLLTACCHLGYPPGDIAGINLSH